MKTCKGPCGKQKLVIAFSKNSTKPDGLQDECKECRNAYNSQWRKDNPRKKREHQLRYKYGISTEQYNAMFIKQRGVCAICGHPEPSKDSGKPSWLIVDHLGRTSGKVRGLLCSSCNKGLGMFKDNIKSLKGAIEYLNKQGKDYE